MTNIHPIMTRVAYVTTENTGGSLDVPTPECVMKARRVAGGGVLVMVQDRWASIQSKDLAIIGRFFLAAALLLGEDINKDWDKG